MHYVNTGIQMKKLPQLPPHLKQAYDGMVESLASCYRERQMDNFINELIEKHDIGETDSGTVKALLYNDAIKTVDLTWPNLKQDYTKVYSTSLNHHPYEVALALVPNAYFCFGTAAYLNGLSNQIPKNLYVGKDRHTKKKRGGDIDFDEFDLIDQFMKPYRETNKFCLYKDSRITIVERDIETNFGVLKNQLELLGKKTDIVLTDIERTLIDISVRPDRSGGVLRVLDCFEKAKSKFKIEKLINHYKYYNFAYPYWQRIGFYMDICGYEKFSNIWRDAFGPAEVMFFSDRLYKSDWLIDDKWKVAFPQGLRK